jgi:hypothetical protein
MGEAGSNNENDILICFCWLPVDRGVVRMEVHESRGLRRKKDERQT